jgi:cell division protein FtsZ
VAGAPVSRLNVTGPPGIGLFEVNEAAEVVTSAADPNANIIFGAVIDESLGDELRVTVIATGFGTRKPRRQRERPVETRIPAAAMAGGARRERDPEEIEIPSFLRDDS